jgi:protein-L-isoaspartate(D-aspartate) O-methyltransferase
MLTNMTASTSATSRNLASQRQTMVDCQIRTFEVTDQVVLDRFLETPRESYVPGTLAALAYSDAQLELVSTEGETRCLLTPMVLARMVQGAGVKAEDRILDVAGGAGYTAAILAGLGKSVVTLEPISSLSALAETQLALAGFNALAVCGPLDARSGIDGMFDLIFVNGAVEEGLEPLFARLAPGGRLLAVQRSANDPSGNAAKVVRFEKSGDDLSRRVLFDASAALLAPFARRSVFVF